MNEHLNVDYTIPLWGIISLIAAIGVPVIWGLITMYFGLKSNKTMIINLEHSFASQMGDLKDSHNKEITNIRENMQLQEKAINSFKRDIEDKLDRHKLATDQKLSSINEVAIETKTLVKLLVDNKLK